MADEIQDIPDEQTQQPELDEQQQQQPEDGDKPKPKFNPDKPFTAMVENKPAFDPAKPYDVKKKKVSQPFSGILKNRFLNLGTPPEKKDEQPVSYNPNSPRFNKVRESGNGLVLGNGTVLDVESTGFGGIPIGFGKSIDEIDNVKRIQKKIDDGNISMFDIDAISKMTKKPVQAVSAYLKGDDKKGQAFERADVIKRNAEDLTNIIDQYNLDFGDSKNPKEILASADKTSQFLNDYITTLVKSNPIENLKKKMDEQGHDVDLENIATLIKYDPALQQQIAKYNTIMGNSSRIVNELSKHIIKTTASEDYANGVARDVTAEKIAQRLDPIGYKNAKKALSMPSGLDALSDKSNPFEIAGALIDELKGNKNFKDQMLNSIVGKADFELNNAYMDIANDKAALSQINGDENALTEARLIYSKVDNNLLKKYPSLQLQQMTNELSNDIATKAGQLKGTETQDGNLKYFGARQEDVIQMMHDKGWFSDPEKRPFAMQILSNPDLLKDASYFGGVTESFMQPFKDLGLSIMDLTGGRTFRDVYADKTKDELFPKEFAPDQTKTSFTLLGHDFKTRNIVNGISNLSGLVVGNIITEGALGEAVSVNNARRISAYMTFGIPSIDANLKDSYNFIDDDAQRAAYVTLGALINGEGGALLDLGKLSKIEGMPDIFKALSKNIVEKNLPEKAVNELLEQGQNKYVDFVTKYGKIGGNITKETLKGAATMSYFTFANEYNKLLNGDPNTQTENMLPHAANAFMEGVFTMLPFGFIQGVKGSPNPNSTYKEMFSKIAMFPDAAEDAFRLGAKSPADFNFKMQVLNTARVAKNALDVTERETGIQLDPSQRSVYIANKTIEASLREKASTTTNPDAKEKYIMQADELAEQSTKTLDGLKFTPTLEPMYDLYDAEKKYNKAYDDFHAGNMRDDTALLEAKNDYEKLQYKYFNENKQPVGEQVIINGNVTSRGHLLEILDKGQQEADKYDIEYTGSDSELHNRLQAFGGITEGDLTISPKGREVKNSEGAAALYDKLEGKIGGHYLDPLNKEGSINELTNQALTAPGAIHSALNYNDKLTLELIARNTTEDINKSIDKWADSVKGENVPPSQINDADRHIRLLEQALEYKAKEHDTSKPVLKDEDVADAFEEMKKGIGQTPDTFSAKEGNRIVDEDGKPKKVYHVTNENFKEFDLEKTAQGIIWFTDSKKSIDDDTTGAGLYPGKDKIVMERQINLKNPAGWDEYEKYGLSELQQRGYDGVILPDKEKTDYIVFDPKSIREVPAENKNTEAFDNAQSVIDRVSKSEPINEKEINDAQDLLYDALDKFPEASHLIEPLILKLQGYEHTTETKNRTVTEEVPVEGTDGVSRQRKEIKPALEQSIGKSVTVTLPDGGVRKGTLDVKSGQYVVDIPGGRQVVLGEKAITDRDLKLPPEDRVADPIEFDADGNVASVTFETRNGNLVKLEDPEKALDIAIQLQAEAVGEIPDAAFEKVFKKVQKEIQVEVPKAKIVGEHNGTKIVSTSDAQAFRDAIEKAMSQRGADRFQADVHPVGYYQEILDTGGKLFLSQDGKFGGFVQANGYMGSLFKNPEADAKGVAKALQQIRVENGGRFFDAYGTHLEDIYIQNGFRPVARLKFNEEYAPAGWQDSNLKDKPDVVFFAYDPKGEFKKGDGKYFEDYQEAYIFARDFNSKENEQVNSQGGRTADGNLNEDVAMRQDVSETGNASNGANNSGHNEGQAGDTGAGGQHPEPTHINNSTSTQEFFSNTVNGANQPKTPWKPLLPVEGALKKVYDTWQRFRGSFDAHIETNIPAFRDVQIRKINAIADTLPDGGLVIDLGGSEGGFGKTLTELNPKIKTVNLDMNPDMEAAHNRNPVEGAEFVKAAFGEDVPLDDGTVVKRHQPQEKADVVHESMMFQFIMPERKSFIDEIADHYVKEDGVVILEEKVKAENWSANELKKDTQFKSDYYDSEAVKKKNEEVVVGMKGNQAEENDLLNDLSSRFKYVYQYWDAGNFKGYIASNDGAKAKQMLDAIGDTTTDYTSREKLVSIEDGVINNQPDYGVGNVPPSGAASTANNAAGNNFTHINKADITSAKDLAKKYPIQGGYVSWQESVDTAMDTLAKDAKPGETLFDVANRKVADWGMRINNELLSKGKTTFNPTDEDLAVMSFYRTQLNEKLDGLKDAINSDSDAERFNALNQAQVINDNILGVDRVLSESGRVAGRSFYIRQAMAQMDANSNLLVRRMDIMRSQNGQPLSAAQEAAVTKIAAEEVQLQKEAETNIPKYSQEDFDAKVKQEVDRLVKERTINKGDKGEVKKEKTLKQTGEEWADKILKAKIKTDPNILQSNIFGLPIGTYNLLIETVATLVKGGATIADAIAQVLKDARFGAVDKDDLVNHLLGGFEKEDALTKILEMSKKEDSESLTKSAVGKGLINDLVNSYIERGLRGKDVFNELNTDLREIFPTMSEQQVRDAYLKTGEFKLDKKENVDRDKIEAQAQLKNIAKLESRLADAKENRVGAKSDATKRKWSEIENNLKKELDSELNKRNIVLERGSKDDIEVKKKVAESHNDRMDKLVQSIDEKLKDDTLSDSDKDALKGLKNTAELSKVDPATSEKIDQALKKSMEDLRKSSIDVVGHEDVFNQVSSDIADLSTGLKDASQDILLARHKKNLESKIKEAERKIEANEFSDEPKAVRLKTDAEAIRLELEANKIESKYNRLQYLAQEGTKKWWEKGLSLAQTFLVNELIGGIKTALVVASSGISKQPLNTLTNATFGKIAHMLNPTLSKAAGAEAPITLRQEANRYTAHYRAIGENGMKKIFEKSEENLKEANDNYNAVKERVGDPVKGTSEYRQLQRAKNKQINALIDHQSNFLFKWIGSSAWKDGADLFLKGANQLDEMMGKTQKVGWKDMTNFEKTEFVMSLMGAAHGYFKNFSARAEFAGAFTARLENKARRGVDISQTDEILKTANESFVNYLMGKYQEDNYATSLMNKIGRMLEEVGNEPSRQGADMNPKNAVLGKAAAAVYKGKYPIVRTGVNIGREAIVEYLLGTPIGAVLHGKEVASAAIKAAKEGKPLMETIRENVMKMSPDKVDLILRCYRKGGFGLVMFGLAAMGYVKYGGFYGDEDWKRKAGQLKPGDLEIFGVKLGHDNIVSKLGAGVFTHSAAFMPALMVANYKQAYARKIKSGKTKGDAEASATAAVVSDLQAALRIIPVFNNSFQNPLTSFSVPYGRAAADVTEYFDTDEHGHTVQRDKSTWWNRFKINTGFRSFVDEK